MARIVAEASCLLLFLASLLAPQFQGAAAADSFNFFVSVLNLPTSKQYDNPGSLSQGIFFKWSWDTCAGAPSPYDQSKMTSLGCVDGNNKVQTIDLTRVFSSVQKFVMRQNFPGSETFNEYALVPGGGATTTLLAQGDLSASTLLNIGGPLFLLNSTTQFGKDGSTTLASLKSDYYCFVMQATDTLGRNVSGKSDYFAIQAADPLPKINQVQIVTPLLGSILLANSDFLVRWTVAPTSSYYPTLFNLTILDASTQQPLSPDLVGPNPVYVNSNSFFIDKSLGDDLTTNATKWSIPANLTNGRYRLQWTGISGLTTSSVTSDPFIVGPVKPSTSK